MGNWDVSKPNNDGERELLDRAVKALEAELATKTCNKKIASKLENAELARDSRETCNNKQVSCKLVASEDERMTREEIKNIPELVDLMLDNCVLADTRTKLCKKLKEVCDLAIKALEQEPSEDAIGRQAAIDAIGKDVMGGLNYWGILTRLPSVTPKQRTGHWIETAEEYYKAVNEYGGGMNEDTPYFVDDIACSECLSMFSVIDNETERFDCCPHCGAKMVEPQESEEQS